jgi:two-component system, NarL family, nitrate/nitrite response regulator NarL
MESQSERSGSEAPRAGQSREQGAASSPLRVILADSQAIYRVGIGNVFAQEADIQLAGQAESLPQLRAVLKNSPAEVLLLDWAMLGNHGELIGELIKLAPEIRVIVQGTVSDETRVVELYRNGVRGIIPRSISPDLLVKCVRKIAAGETWIDNQSVTWLIEAYRLQAAQSATGKAAPRLSPKEMSIIGYISQGKRNKEIAHHIGTSEQVIKNYLRKIYDKLGVSDRLELALYCIHHDLQRLGTANGATLDAAGRPISRLNEV